jgi:hypothetical protein
MTVDKFRQMALALPEVEERAHHGHPDFRVRGKIFATLGYPDKGHGALMLTPEQQKARIHTAVRAFSPAAGAWGVAGATIVRLKDADAETVGEAMTLAWQDAASKSAGKRPRTRAAKRRRTT